MIPSYDTLTPAALRRILNIYGPYLGSGIRVDSISEDWQRTSVSMALRWYNRNVAGVHFGGSLYAMVDPHLMLMLMKLLGTGYLVWDKSAAIEFVRPGKGSVFATCEISDTELDTIKEQVALHRRYLPEFNVEVLDETGKTVARINKVLYVRKRRKPSGAA